MLSDNTSFSSPESEEKKSRKSKSKDKSSRDHKELKRHKDDRKSNHRDSKNYSAVSKTEDSTDTDATKSSEEDSDAEDKTFSKQRSNRRNTRPKRSDTESPSFSFKKTTTSSSLKSTSSSSTAQMLSRFASGTSIAKKQALERKEKAHASNEQVSSEGESGDNSMSEFEDSDEELDGGGSMTEIKKEILAFFQDASIDELSLIAGCSVKKAQKIVELRPYDSWKSLVRQCDWQCNIYYYSRQGLIRGLFTVCTVVTSGRLTCNRSVLFRLKCFKRKTDCRRPCCWAAESFSKSGRWSWGSCPNVTPFPQK